MGSYRHQRSNGWWLPSGAAFASNWEELRGLHKLFFQQKVYRCARKAPSGPPDMINRTIRRRVCALLGLLWFVKGVPSLAGQQPQPDPTIAPVTEKSNRTARFTKPDRLRFYRETTFSPTALLGPLAGAAVNEWATGNPREWGQGFPGYGRRVLSGYGRQVIANTVALGVAFATSEDPRHYPTGERSVWSRGLLAARESFVSHSTTGGLMPAYSRIIGDYAAGFASNGWYPASNSNFHGALYRGSTALASGVVWEEFKEFWPDVRRKLRHRR